MTTKGPQLLVPQRSLIENDQDNAFQLEVFERLLKAQPDNPRLHYMLGYLRESQDRPVGAIKSFRRATELDPDYINAWRHLADFNWDDLPVGTISTAERDEMTFALLRLDPHRRHAHVSTHDSRTSDVRVWLRYGFGSVWWRPSPCWRRQ